MAQTPITIEPIPAAPVVPGLAPLKGESYWDLVLRQFRRNRLAVASFYFVLTLSLIAVIAPFLAGNIPIVMNGVYRGAYNERFEEWKLGGHPELVGALQAWEASHTPEAAAAITARLTTIDRQLTFLKSQLASEQARSISQYISEYYNIAQSVEGGAQSAAQLAKLDSVFQEISQRFDPARVQLQQKLYWPVVSQLTWLDVFFMTLTAMIVFVVVFWKALPAAWKESGAVLFLLISLPPVLVAAYRATQPIPLQTMDYKQDLFNGRIESSLALFPPVQYGINEASLGDKYLGPGARYWMGTDGNGRDLLTRMIWGARISLSVGFVAVAIYTVIGILFGTIAGYFRGWVDMVLSRIIEIVICFPAFFLILAVLAFLQPSILNIMIVIGITGWTTEARLVRGEFLRLNDQEFVLAAKGLGVSDARIIFRHILPNGLAPLLVSASFGVASAILIESSLSFLGFGISIPVPSWGGILNEARENFRYWWITMFPGLAIFSTVTAYNLLGEGARDAIDPRLKQ
ncbi:MAG: ABC transporter permease [Acidobacteria bacterium]|nr:ABC transporter permease [Acidobacteriota bacterium]